MAESRFTFLQDHFPELYKKCVHAEEASEYDVSMLRIRQTLEYIVHDLGADSQDLFQGINELEERNVVNLETSHRFHTVRRITNQAVHGQGISNTAAIEQCLNDLLLLAVWYGLQKGQTYTLEQFRPDDAAVVRSYLTISGTLPKEAAGHTAGDVMSVDPLSVSARFQIPDAELQQQNVLERDVFETQEEYEHRIEAMDPVHIGYGILDTRRKDGYTSVHFLVHHIDHNRDIQFSSISAFYTDGMEDEQVVDSELVAKLKVYENKVCCDYSHVYLQHDSELIPVHPICWEPFHYESDEEYKKRISTMPLMPFGIGMPVRNQYDLKNNTLPVIINPFQYTEKILTAMLPENRTLVITCERDMARAFCSVQRPCMFFATLRNLQSFKQYVIWREDLGVIVTYEKLTSEEMVEKVPEHLSDDIKEKENIDENNVDTQESNPEAMRYYKKVAIAERQLGPLGMHLGRYLNNITVQKILVLYKEAATRGHLEAAVRLGDCYAQGRGVEVDYQQAVEWYQKAAVQDNAEAAFRLGECYAQGHGVEVDYQQAVEWYRKAAAKDNAEAEVRLGECYVQGHGVEVDYQQAVGWYQKAAVQDNAEAAVRLGDCYANGIGIQVDYRKAAAWYRKAAEQGNAEADFRLGQCYANGNGVQQDYTKAVEYYRKAAEQGSAEAQFQLCNCYANGNGVQQDYKKAIEWLEKAVKQGYAGAIKYLTHLENAKFYSEISGLSPEELYQKGLSYIYGDGVPKNIQMALVYIEISAEQGNAEAQNRLGEWYERKQNYKKAMEFYSLAAKQGQINAMYQLGLAYHLGRGVVHDDIMAINWLEKAASQGHAAAKIRLKKAKSNLQNMICQECQRIEKAAEKWNVESKACVEKVQNDRFDIETTELSPEELYRKGLAYKYGDGVSKNLQKSVVYIEKAAEQGHAEAQFLLGKCYASGQGVSHLDYQKAIQWLEKAKQQGHIRAKEYLTEVKVDAEISDLRPEMIYHKGIAYKYGDGVPKNLQKSVAYIEKAAKQGYMDAQVWIGKCYALGIDVPKNYRKATEWYQKAAVQGCAEAQIRLGEFYEAGYGVTKDYQKANEWYRKAAKQGNAEAQFHLGKCYATSRGVLQDYEKAIKYLEKAASQGHAEAKEYLEKVKIARLSPIALYRKGVAYENGYGVTQDSQKAVACIEKAAVQGSAEAQFLLGEYYEKGYGVAKDIQKAVEWYEKAAAWYEKNAAWGKAEACRHKIERIAPKSAKKSAETNEPDKKANTSAVPKKSGCFITTAVCDSLKKEDHCYELTCFREFRDQWLALQEDGPALIQEYYAVAPAIVEKIQAQRQCEIVYHHIWNGYLKPCLTYIEEKNFEACKSLYIEMVRTLQDKYLRK